MQTKVLYPLSFNVFNVFKGTSAVLKVPSMIMFSFWLIALWSMASNIFDANL